MSPNWTRAVNDCWPRERLGEGGEGRGEEPGREDGVHVLKRREEQEEKEQGEEQCKRSRRRRRKKTFY